VGVAVGDGLTSHYDFFGGHLVFESTLTGQAGGDKNQVGAFVVPQGVGGDHVGNDRDEGGAVMTERFEEE
jgi:hypothetical protein